jgi:hypothetical protein
MYSVHNNNVLIERILLLAVRISAVCFLLVRGDYFFWPAAVVSSWLASSGTW